MDGNNLIDIEAQPLHRFVKMHEIGKAGGWGVRVGRRIVRIRFDQDSLFRQVHHQHVWIMHVARIVIGDRLARAIRENTAADDSFENRLAAGLREAVGIDCPGI